MDENIERAQTALERLKGQGVVPQVIVDGDLGDPQEGDRKIVTWAGCTAVSVYGTRTFEEAAAEAIDLPGGGTGWIPANRERTETGWWLYLATPGTEPNPTAHRRACGEYEDVIRESEEAFFAAVGKLGRKAIMASRHETRDHDVAQDVVRTLFGVRPKDVLKAGSLDPIRAQVSEWVEEHRAHQQKIREQKNARTDLRRRVIEEGYVPSSVRKVVSNSDQRVAVDLAEEVGVPEELREEIWRTHEDIQDHIKWYGSSSKEWRTMRRRFSGVWDTMLSHLGLLD